MAERPDLRVRSLHMADLRYVVGAPGDDVPDPSIRPTALLPRIFRPYIDLTDEADAPIHARGAALAYRVALGQTSERAWTQLAVAPALRQLFRFDVDLAPYAVRTPDELPVERQSPPWKALVDLCADPEALPVRVQADLVRLLGRLGFTAHTLGLLPVPTEDEIADDPDVAWLAFVHAAVRSVHHTGFRLAPRSSTITYWPTDLIAVAEHAPRESRARLSAAIRLCVFFGKFAPSAAQAAHWAAEATTALEELSDDVSAWQRSLLFCTTHRATAFAPFLRRDLDGVERELAMVEDVARGLPRDSDDHALLAVDNLCNVIETRHQEALARRDLDLAVERLRETAELNPFDGMRQVKLGEVLVSAGDERAALDAFESAAALGPPGAGIGAYRAGALRERIDDLRGAAARYEQALRWDPGLLGALERLIDIYETLGQPRLAAAWTAELRSYLDPDVEQDPDRASHRI